MTANRFLRAAASALRPFWLAASDTLKHDGVEHAGYLAFLFLLSLFPFIVFLTALTGWLGQTEIGVSVTGALLHNDVLPQDVAESLRPRIEEIVSGPPQELLTLAIVGAIWTASSIVEGMRTIFNRAYRIESLPPYILRRLMSIGQFLLLTGVLVASIAVFIVVPTLLESLPQAQGIRNFFSVAFRTGGIDTLLREHWNLVRLSVAAFILVGLVSLCYAAIPNARYRHIRVLPGACTAVLLWFACGKLFGLYLKTIGQVELVYGSLGGIIAALIFFYLAAGILIYGAELNYHWRRKGLES
jgi:membrane protein